MQFFPSFYYNNLHSDKPVSYQWATISQGIDTELPRAMTTDLTGAVITTGEFESSVDFDPGTGTTTATSNGNLDWVRTLGSSGYDRGLAIQTDAQGNIYVTGEFTGTVDFDPGSPTVNVSSNGFTDVFILKLNSNGNFQWVKLLEEVPLIGVLD